MPPVICGSTPFNLSIAGFAWLSKVTGGEEERLIRKKKGRVATAFKNHKT
jgi:hypothetical protein